MKNIFKLLPIVFLFVFVGCEEEDDRFGGDETAGWVEFLDASTIVDDSDATVMIPVNVRVPVFTDGIKISYKIQTVQGDFESYVFSDSGTLIADPKIGESSTGSGRDFILEVPLRNLEAERRFVTIFDVVITSVEPFSVTVGVDGSSITSHRVTIGCNAITPDNLEADFLIGDFIISDDVAAIGPGLVGVPNFPDGTVTISADEDNPNIRNFSAAILPEFGLPPFDLTLELVDGKLVFGETDILLGCSDDNIFYTSAGGSDKSYDVCDDPNSITIFYAEDSLGSCGGPFLSSFTLTKVDAED